MKNNYELTIVFSPELTAQKREELLAKIFKKTSLKTEELGVLPLAYPIKGKTQGHYVRCQFEAEPTFSEKLRQTIQLLEGILRYLLIRI